MENKKAMQINSPHEDSEAILKHVHQHNPQQMRLLQYGLKLNQPHQHQPQQQLNAPNVYSHVHQHPPQPSYHKHPLPAPEHKYQPNIYTNQLHQHVQPNSRPKTETVQYQTHYQSNENAYNPLKQQNPQIWVPHQPPAHYHQQQQVKIENQQKQQSPNQSGAPQIKPKTVERKKSSSGNQQLRSPVAKRPSHAPVEMQGWLYKQGSEGLMLWKKRWFVLSEYCLFYYKGPEEDKLLGSILLPSYKVSVCGSEAKFNKKYAFKLEHANMRTYILAADSQELMAQWILNLNAACLLQSHSEPVIAQPVSSSNSNQNESNYQHNQRHTFATTPVHMHSSSNATDLSSPSQQELSQYSQPLYANAPPKPRRLNDGSYSSPSPEISERYVSDLRYSHLNAMKRSPVPMYGGPEYVARMPHIQSREYDMTPVRDVYGLLPNTERRTPDTYGRSSLNAPKSRYPGDYEDVYAEQAMYKRPISPLAYSNVKKTNPSMQHTYTPVSMMPQREMYPQQAVQMRRPPNVTIPRPHSADFLEYEFSRRTDPSSVPVQQARPKSSLDINRNTLNDNYFYSEKQYAANMRKSAQYLPKQHMPKRPIQNKCLGNLENTFPLMRSNTQPLHLDNVGNDSSKHCIQPVRSRSVLSEGSLTKELDVRGSPYESYGQESSSPVVTSHREQYYMQEGRRREYDQFTRSASARLPYANQHEQIHDGRSTARDGEKKREESMKRLLEWKQRMLQSPLNRKVNQSNMRGRNEYYYRNVDNGYQIKTPGDPYTDTQKATNTFPQYNSYSSDDEASGSVSLNIRDTFPRAISAKRVWTPTPQMGHSRSALSIPKVHESDYNLSRQSAGQYGASQHDIQLENIRKANWKWNEKMNMSAGELLGRTHEELVLLLIQLRRQSTNICHAIEACYNEIDNIQAQLHLMDQVKKLENLQKLDQIKQHLIELEKQYEKGKPLVNLVDNMVKLGSLYRSPSDRLNPYVRDRIEFNQQIQERRLLAEERRDWNRLNPNHAHLQEKVQELYQLDRLIQEESSTLQNLQQDKEDIERALGDLRQRINKGFSDPAEIDQARKQQMMLEKELTRVHSKLAENSKKLEETVAGNARLEQKLLVLKQKLQLSRQQRSSPQFSNPGDSLPCFVGTSAMLESDLQRVQQKVGDLQRQRKELSMQVRQLTDRSNNLQQQIKPLNGSSQNREGNKKKTPSSWRETDLDTMSSVDHGDSWENPLNSPRTTPLYINTDLRHNPDCDPYGRSMRSSDSASDDTTQNSSCHQEKQEIKTVRIVKRESERRQREREKLPAGKWESLIEEDDSSQSSSILFCPTVVQKTQSSSNLLSTSSEGSKNSSSILSRQNSVSSPSIQAYSEDSLDKSELSPVFKSEAARQIITEVSVQEKPKQLNRRAVPKEKRRHYTAPHNNLIMKSLNQLPTDDSVFDKSLLDSKRARDDLDMERALRQRIDAPDVVRSTLSNKELKYNENTIDSILGTPNKINIPERYIPEQLPQLSAEEQEHRLRKVESIKKMLSDTIISSNTVNLNAGDGTSDKTLNSLTNKATSKMIEEKKQREHLLQLNQILAKQVMEMSKIVAGTNTPGEQ